MRRILLLCFLLASCSASTAGPGGGALDDAAALTDGGTTDDAESKADAGGGKGDGGASDATPPSVPYCQMTCSTAADCATASGAFDADNYACEAGLCRYKGCNDDAECQAAFSSAGYVCRAQSGLKTCVKRCAAPADCAVASAAFDADNYACEAGGCRYNGCNDDAECAASVAGTVCRKAFGATSAACIKKCSVAADCAAASAAFDDDNYACETGLCRYKGCNSDAECQSSLMKANYACR